MVYYYAQLNDDGICFSVSQLLGCVDSDNMILIESLDDSLLGKKYVDGEWT